MSGGEPSSIKQSPRCAARVPVPSSDCVCRVEGRFEVGVYGLTLQSAFSKYATS